MMDYPYYVIKIINLISGPQPSGDTIRLQVNPYWKSEDDCSINPKGSYDKGIAKGDTVEVLGCYEADGPRVSISDKDYYIKKLGTTTTTTTTTPPLGSTTTTTTTSISNIWTSAAPILKYQIQRIIVDQAVYGKANVVTVQVEYDPNTDVSTITKAWGQDATVVGPNIEAGANYAIRSSDETPTQEVSAVANIKFELSGVGLQLGAGASQEGNLGSSSGPLDFQGSAGIGPGSGQLSTDGWEGVNVDLVGVGVGTAMTTGAPWQISDPNSIPDKAIFDTIINEISKRNGRATAGGGSGSGGAG